MSLDNVTVPSSQFWMSAVIMGILDVAFIAVLIWRIKPSRFRELRWTLAGTAVVFWSAFAVWLVRVFWDAYYRYFYPTSFRSGGLLIWVPLVFAILALAFHWLALRMPGNPIIFFCLFGGTESLIEHLWGIYVFGIFQVPLLREASTASILAFSFPEYVFYWCMVISIAALLHHGWSWLRKRRVPGTVVA